MKAPPKAGWEAFREFVVKGEYIAQAKLAMAAFPFPLPPEIRALVDGVPADGKPILIAIYRPKEG
jgi:hypothetical protein